MQLLDATDAPAMLLVTKEKVRGEQYCVLWGEVGAADNQLTFTERPTKTACPQAEWSLLLGMACESVASVEICFLYSLSSLHALLYILIKIVQALAATSEDKYDLYACFSTHRDSCSSSSNVRPLPQQSCRCYSHTMPTPAVKPSVTNIHNSRSTPTAAAVLLEGVSFANV